MGLRTIPHPPCSMRVFTHLCSTRCGQHRPDPPHAPPVTHPLPPCQVVLPDAFRPRDVVRARVLSLGDARSFFLTTAHEALGVVAAKGPAGGWEGVLALWVLWGTLGGSCCLIGTTKRTHDLLPYACLHCC